MKLSKFDPMPEEWTPDDEDGVFTIVALPGPKVGAFNDAFGVGNPEAAARIIITAGVEKIENLTDADGNDITTGPELWRAFNNAGMDGAALIQVLVSKIVAKSTLTKESVKNS